VTNSVPPPSSRDLDLWAYQKGNVTLQNGQCFVKRRGDQAAKRIEAWRSSEG